METLTAWSVQQPKLAITVVICSVFVCLLGTRNLIYEQDVRAIFSDDDPQRIALEKLEESYGQLDNAIQDLSVLVPAMFLLMTLLFTTFHYRLRIPRSINKRFTQLYWVISS